MSTAMPAHLSAPRALALAVVALALVATALLAAPAAHAQDRWAAADEATIHPGVQMFTDGAQCTANFVFTDGADVLIGYAAHCAGTGESTQTDGCQVDSLPLGTAVEIDGATKPGTLAYSSWETMGRIGENDPATCRGNDFALVRIDPADHGRVNPSLPFWGGPEGIDADGVVTGERVYSYGNSSLRPKDSPLSWKDGYAVQTTNDGWSHTLYTLSPGIPGDSGSAYVDGDGEALGILSTLTIAPLTGSNTISDAKKAIDYANAEGGMSVTLQDGTEAFSGSLIGPIG